MTWLFPSFHWNLVRAVSTILLVGDPESSLAPSLKFFFCNQLCYRLSFLITLYMRAFWLCLRMGSNPLLQIGEKHYTPPALRPPFSFLRSALFTSLLWFLPCALDFAFGLLISLWRSSGGFWSKRLFLSCALSDHRYCMDFVCVEKEFVREIIIVGKKRSN